MTDKITLPMAVSKGVDYEFHINNLPETAHTILLDMIMQAVEDMGGTLAGGFFSTAHMEELEQEKELPDSDVEVMYHPV